MSEQSADKAVLYLMQVNIMALLGIFFRVLKYISDDLCLFKESDKWKSF